MSRSLYDLLGVETDASADQIEAAYARIAARTDPSIGGNPADQEAISHFNLVRDAHRTLTDPVARRLYDEARKAPRNSPVRFDYAEPYAQGSFFDGAWKLVGIAMLLLGGAYAYNSYHTTQVQKEALEIIRHQQATDERLREEARLDQLRREADYRMQSEQNEQNQMARRQQAEFERARQEADFNAARMEEAERRNKQEQEMAQRRREAESRNQQQRQHFDSLRQAERDRAYLRQLEAENRSHPRWQMQ